MTIKFNYFKQINDLTIALKKNSGHIIDLTIAFPCTCLVLSYLTSQDQSTTCSGSVPVSSCCSYSLSFINSPVQYQFVTSVAQSQFHYITGLVSVSSLHWFSPRFFPLPSQSQIPHFTGSPSLHNTVPMYILYRSAPGVIKQLALSQYSHTDTVQQLDSCPLSGLPSRISGVPPSNTDLHFSFSLYQLHCCQVSDVIGRQGGCSAPKPKIRSKKSQNQPFSDHISFRNQPKSRPIFTIQNYGEKIWM